METSSFLKFWGVRVCVGDRTCVGDKVCVGDTECVGDRVCYQRPQVWVGQDVVVVSDGKRISMDPQLEEHKKH